MSLQNSIGILIVLLTSVIALIPEIERYLNGLPAVKWFDRASRTIADKYYKYIVMFFMCTGSAVRLWKFGVIPAGFNQDGAMGAVDALALAQHGTDRFGMWLPVHFTAWGYGQMSVLLSYLSVPFIALYGLNRYTARIAVVIVSLLALWVLYSLCTLLFGRGTGLAVLAFCAVNPWQVMQSRWALDCNLLPHFFLFSLYFLCMAFKKSKKFLYISMVFFGLTMYTYGIAWYVVPLFLVIAGVYLMKTGKISVRELMLSALTYMLFAWPIFGVMIVNTFKFPTINTPFLTVPFFPGTARKADIIFFSKDFTRQLVSNFKAAFDVVILQKPDLPWNTIPEYGTVYLFSIPFFIIGLIVLIRNKKASVKKSDNLGREQQTLIIIWLITAVVSGLIINGVNVNRINIIFYPVIILCAIGIYFIASKVKLLGMVILLTYVVAFAGFNYSYFGEHSKVIGESFYDGFGEAMEYVKDMDYDVVYITNHTQSENSWWVSEPLALFHHQIDAVYYQGKAQAFSKSGKKLQPYKERYKYVNFKDFKLSNAQNAVYIVHKDEINKFDKNAYIIKKFSSYNAVIPKR